MKYRFIVFIAGFGLTWHHKLVTKEHVWYSTNQAFYECHGKIGIILMVVGLVLVLQNIYMMIYHDG